MIGGGGMLEEPAGGLAAEGIAIETATEESLLLRGAGMGQPGAPGPDLGQPGDQAGGVGEAGGGVGEAGGDEDGEGHKKAPRPSGRSLTTIIVFATLVAALGGLLLNRASAASSDAGDLAQALGLRAGAAETSAYAQAETNYSQYLTRQALEAKAAQQMLEAADDAGSGPMWAALYRSSTDQANQAARSVPGDLHPYLANGDPDPNFPYDFYASRASTGTYLEAQSDADNDVSGDWNRLVDSYTAIVTMVAVALFLFGSAYVLYGRNRLTLSVLGLVLLSVATAWGGFLVAVKQPSPPPPVSSRDYERGVLAMAEASTPDGYLPAIADFTAAIKARPDFALAYSERAAAEALHGSQQIGFGFISNVSTYWLERSAADFLEAYKLGARDAEQVLNVGYGAYQSWMAAGGKGSPPPSSVTFFHRSVQLDPGNPTGLVDYALAELAERHYAVARAGYVSALTHMLFTCRAPAELSTCTEPQPATSYGLQQAWVAGTLETLEALDSSSDAAGSSQLRAAIDNIRSMVTDSIAAGKVVEGPAPASTTVHGMIGFLDPNFLGLDVPVPQGTTPLHMASTPLLVVWYERPPGAAKWSAIPETLCWGHGTEPCLGYLAQANDLEFVTRFLEAAGSCFTNVDYKAELYMRGELVGSLDLSPKNDYIHTNLKAALAKDMNMGICVPATWHRQAPLRVSLRVAGSHQTVSGPLSGSELGFVSADRSEGVYMFRLYPPDGSQVTTTSGLQNMVESVANYAIDILKGRALPTAISLNGQYAPHELWGGISDMMTAPFIDRATKTEAFVGAGIIGPATGGSPAATDNGIAKSITADHAVMVTVVYGPQKSVLWADKATLGIQVFSSWSLLDYG